MIGALKLIRRATAGASFAAWGAALCLPSYVTLIENDPKRPDELSGLVTMLFGWLGPIDGLGAAWPGMFAWFANPLLLWNIWRLLRGQAANYWAGVLGPSLAATALAEHRPLFGDDHGVNGATVPAIGAYVWAAAFVPIAFLALAELLTELFRRRRKSLPLSGRLSAGRKRSAEPAIRRQN